MQSKTGIQYEIKLIYCSKIYITEYIYYIKERIKMITIKCIILFSIFISSSFLGIALANRYKYRVKDLKEMRSALNIVKTKIEYTYEPLPQVFLDISNEYKSEVRRNL